MGFRENRISGGSLATVLSRGYVCFGLTREITGTFLPYPPHPYPTLICPIGAGSNRPTCARPPPLPSLVASYRLCYLRGLPPHPTQTVFGQPHAKLHAAGTTFRCPGQHFDIRALGSFVYGDDLHVDLKSIQPYVGRTRWLRGKHEKYHDSRK